MGTASPLAKRLFEQEVETYERHKPELLATARGKYIVILGGDIIGIFDTDDEAYTQAYRRLGMRRFLLREITEEDPVYTIGGSMLGVTNSTFTAMTTEDAIAATPPNHS